MLVRLVVLVIPEQALGPPPHVRRGKPEQAAQRDHHANEDQAGSPLQVQQRKHAHHDRHRDDGRPRDGHKRHVDEKSERDRAQRQPLPDPVRPQQTDDRIGQCDRAQRKLLALIDVILDKDAALRLPVRLERKAGIDHDQARHQHQQGAGHQECDQDPHPPRRALEMIDQPGQHQELEGGADGVQPHRPCCVRPECADDGQTDQRQRQIADRPFQQLARRRANPSPMPQRRASIQRRSRPARLTRAASGAARIAKTSAIVIHSARSRQYRRTRDIGAASALTLTACPPARDRPATSCCGPAEYRPARPRRR